MKRLGIIAAMAVLFVSQGAYAQLDNLINSSAEWIRTPARNAATDAGDIVIYNPAGLVRLNNGFNINIGNQSLFRKPSHTYDFGLGGGEQSFTQDGVDAFIPNLYASYKKDKWALFTGIFISGGGATAKYPNGSINTDLIALQLLTQAQGAYGAVENQHLKASSAYLTTTLGTSLAVSDRISFAVAGRFISATNKTEAGMSLTQSPIGLPNTAFALNTSDKASGFGVVLSTMIKATPKFDMTLRYESAVMLDFETSTKQDDFGATTDGAKSRRDLPAVLAWGGAYSASSTVKVYADVNYYFQKQANWSNSTTVTEEKKWSDLAGNAIAYNFGVTFNATPKFLWSVGGGYADNQYADHNGYYTKLGAYEVAAEDNYNINTGFSYKASPSVTLTCGYMHTFYNTQTIKALNAQPLDVDVKVKNSLDAFAIGANLQF